MHEDDLSRDAVRERVVRERTVRGVSTVLPCVPASAALAREHVRTALVDYRRTEFCDIAELITSELVTNAIKATAVPGYARETREFIRVDVIRTVEAVMLEVWDRSPYEPVLVEPLPEENGGRGLMLVSELAEDWGYRFDIPDGKVVWARLMAPGN